MAEALACLSIAANVMQVISFSRDTISICKRIYEDKSPAPDAAESNLALQRTVQDLQRSVASSSPSRAGDKELHAVADKVITLTNELQVEFRKCEILPGASKVRAFGKALKFNWSRKKKIEELESGLSRLQNTMQTRILIALRQSLDDKTVADISRYTGVDKTLHDFILQLKAGHTDLAHLLENKSRAMQETFEKGSTAIRDDVAQESVVLRTHVTDEVQMARQQMQEAQIQELLKAKREKFLKSLYFEDMHTRRNQVVKAHDKTFKWIFGESSIEDADGREIARSQSIAGDEHEIKDENTLEQQRSATVSLDSHSDKSLETVRWDDLVSWLQNDEPIYWISGKAGSGKSTLMRFLIQDPRTVINLQKWNPDVKILAAFLWTAGSPMQRSLQGILCTLLHELASKDPAFIQKLSSMDNIWEKNTPQDWSREELEHTLHNLIQEDSISLCVFIDGLDEIDSSIIDGQINLLGFIERLSAIHGVKLCLSSRPEPVLDARLRIYPHLRLQDLTARDMKRFVSSRLDTVEMKDWLRDQRDLQILDEFEERPSLDTLVRIIIHRAEGVFLWVCLVISAIQNGVINYDSWEILLQRVDSLPSDLERLYEDMWSRQKEDSKIYRSYTATYLNVVLHAVSNRIPILEMLLNTDPSLRHRLLAGGEYVSSREIIKRCQTLQRQIIARCCGLLEVSTPGTNSNITSTIANPVDQESDLTRQLHDMQEVQVSFIHRSARDFLVDTLTGEEICSHDDRSRLKRDFDAFLGLLAAVLTLGIGPDDGPGAAFYSPGNLLINLYKLLSLHPTCSETLLGPILRLCETSLRRVPKWKELPGWLLQISAEEGLYKLTANILSWWSPTSDTRSDELNSRMLYQVVRGFRAFYADEEGGRAVLTQLLREGINPNAITARMALLGWNESPLTAAMEYISLERHDEQIYDRYKFLLHAFLRHHVDTKLRFLGAIGPARGFLAFPQPFGYAHNRSTGNCYAVLIDMGYPHLFRRYYEKFDKALDIEALISEFGDAAAELFDVGRAEPAKAVLLIRLTRVDGFAREVFGKPIKLPSHSNNLLEGTSLNDPPDESRIEDSSSGTNTSDSATTNSDTHQQLFENDTALDTFYQESDSEELNAPAIVKWLVQHDYLPESAQLVHDACRILIHEILDTTQKRYFDRPHHRSEVNFSYQPEYAKFLEVVEECISKELGNKEQR